MAASKLQGSGPRLPDDIQMLWFPPFALVQLSDNQRGHQGRAADDGANGSRALANALTSTASFLPCTPSASWFTAMAALLLTMASLAGESADRFVPRMRGALARHQRPKCARHSPSERPPFPTSSMSGSLESGGREGGGTDVSDCSMCACAWCARHRHTCAW